VHLEHIKLVTMQINLLAVLLGTLGMVRIVGGNRDTSAPGMNSIALTHASLGRVVLC